MVPVSIASKSESCTVRLVKTSRCLELPLVARPAGKPRVETVDFLVSALHLCDQSVLFMQIQNLVTFLENLCITEKMSQKDISKIMSQK